MQFLKIDKQIGDFPLIKIHENCSEVRFYSTRSVKKNEIGSFVLISHYHAITGLYFMSENSRCA